MRSNEIEVLGKFFDSLFRTGVGEFGSACPTPIDKSAPVSRLLDSALLGRIKWRMDELPGIFAHTPAPIDLVFSRELSRRYYQCCYLSQQPTEQAIQTLKEQCESAPLSINEWQIVAADAICYDGPELLARIERIATTAVFAVERARLLKELSIVLTQLLQASPLTVLRTLAYSGEFPASVWRVILSDPVLQREATHRLAFNSNEKCAKMVTETLNYLSVLGENEFCNSVRAWQARYSGEGNNWTHNRQP
ncbi:MAG: hypothetical protein AB1489_17060 [Acidobacteriota bacterium]